MCVAVDAVAVVICLRLAIFTIEDGHSRNNTRDEKTNKNARKKEQKRQRGKIGSERGRDTES